MKYLLGINNDISGYTNLGIRKDLLEIPESSATEIRATNYFDFIPPENTEKIVETLCSRLTSGGTVAIVMTDLFSVANTLVDGLISLAQFRDIIYGNENEPKKYICCSMDSICEFLSKNNVKVLQKWYNGNQINIIGQKQ